MSIFKLKHYNSQGIYLGKPEAEGESDKILSFFEDYFDLGNSIKQGNFIITGRKGSGKSAYATWLNQTSKVSDELFCSIVKKSEFDLEEIINTLPTEQAKFEVFFEWLILVRLVKLILDSQQGCYLKEYKALKQFYEKNAGYVNIDKYTIVEILKNKEVNFSPLKNSGFNFRNLFSAKTIKAQFYQMITPLRVIVMSVLKMEIFKNLKFYILFDDLDVKLKLSREKDCVMLLDLLRIARRYNTEYLQDTQAKIIVFLRDDIADKLSGIDTDRTKLISSYECTINWYEHDMAKRDERYVLLRRFINKRISIAFDNLRYEYDKDDPWKSFVLESGEGTTSSFKYILNHTFYLPRDLLTIFKNISSKHYSLPLSHTDVNILLREYAPVKKSEIEDELVAIYDKDKVKDIFEVLEQVAEKKTFKYDSLLELMKVYNLDMEDFHNLIEHSLLVPIDENNHLYFSYREQDINQNYNAYSYGVPRFLQVYYKII